MEKSLSTAKPRTTTPSDLSVATDSAEQLTVSVGESTGFNIPPRKGAQSLEKSANARDTRTSNVHGWERGLTLAAATGLAAWSLRSLARRDERNLGLALGAVSAALFTRGATANCPLKRALNTRGANSVAQLSRQRHQLREGHGVHLEFAQTINKSPAELYAVWRNFPELPKFMKHLERVEDLGGGRSRWTAPAPGGTRVSWDARIISDVPNELISWESEPGSTVASAGSVRFAPAPRGRGTQVNIVLKYAPPGGKAGHLFAKLFGKDATQMVRKDLREFKSILECGEAPSTEGQPRGSSHSLI